MICKQCNAQLEENTRFCTKCGYTTEENESDFQMKVDNTEEKKAKSGNKFVRGLLSVLCCIMIFILSFATLTVFTARNSISEERVEQMLDDVDVRSIADNAIDPDSYYEINSREIEKIYNKTSIKDYVEDVAEEYSNYLLGGRKPRGIDGEKVIELIFYENQMEIERITGEELDEEDYDAAYDFFVENGEENLGVFSSEIRTNNALNIARMLLSIYVIIALIVLSLLFVFLLLKVRKYRLDSLVWLSAPLMLTALVFGTLATIKPIAFAVLNGSEPIIIEVVGLFMNNILGTVLINSTLVLLTAIVLIGVFVAVRKIKKMAGKKNAKNAQ